MDGRFVTAFVLPEKWEILGYKLGPFTLRRYMALLAIESPVLTSPAAEISPEDMLIFARICSNKDAFVALKPPTLLDKWKRMRMEVDSAYFVRAVIDSKDYVETGVATPKTFSKDDGVKEFKKENVPSILGLVTSLMSKLNMTPEEAWGCTVGQAVWYLTAYAVSEGAEIRILSTQDEEKIESDRELLQRIQREALARLKKERNT
jgi:hypothetical protein